MSIDYYIWRMQHEKLESVEMNAIHYYFPEPTSEM